MNRIISGEERDIIFKDDADSSGHHLQVTSSPRTALIGWNRGLVYVAVRDWPTRNWLHYPATKRHEFTTEIIIVYRFKVNA